MKKFDEKEIDALSKLCRIHCSEEEKIHLSKKLSSILLHIEQLKNINTEGVKPFIQTIEHKANGMREDIEGELLEREKFLANSPSNVGGMVRIPPVIKFEE